jgi:hypothetical protein
MRFISLLFLFFSVYSFGQNTELEVKIDSITFIPLNSNERKFTINYHIENKTNIPVSLILNTNRIKSNMTHSLSWIPSYRLYQENVTIETDNVFNSKKLEAFFEKMKSEVKSNKGNLTEYLLIQQQKIKAENSKDIINSIIKLNPKEIKKYAAILTWDMKRYQVYSDNEYYLDEKSTHYIDLFLYLNKEELEQHLLPNDLKTILEDKTIAKGWIQSNKMEINFKQ